MKPKTQINIIITIILLTAALMPALAFALETAKPVEFTPSEELPLIGLPPTELAAYLKAIFQFGLAAIAILAVVMLMVGGYQYIFSGGGKGVESAKQRITNALLGLGLALVSWLIVYTINPDLVELKGIRTVSLNVNLPDNPGGGGDGGVEGIPGGFVSDFEKGTSDICEIRGIRWMKGGITLKSESVDIELILPKECTEKTKSPFVQIAVVARSNPFSYALQQFLNEVIDLGVEMRDYIDLQVFPLSQPKNGSFIFNFTWVITDDIRKKLQDNRGWFEDDAGLYLIAQSHTTFIDTEGKNIPLRSNAVASNSLGDLIVELEDGAKCEFKDIPTNWQKYPGKSEVFVTLNPRLNASCFGVGNKLKAQIKSEFTNGGVALDTIKSEEIELTNEAGNILIEVLESEMAAKNIPPRNKDNIYVDMSITNSNNPPVVIDEIFKNYFIEPFIPPPL